MNRKKLLLVFLILLLLACQTPSIAGLPVSPTPASTATLAPTMTAISTLAAEATETSTPTLTPTPAPLARRVLIVTFDGLRPDAIAAADMTNVESLMQTGAYSLTAQTIVPSLTLPSHAAMVTGTCPAKNIVRWNEYVPDNGYALGVDIFDLAHAAGLRTVIVAGKEKLRQITEPSSTDFFGFIDTTDKIKDITTLENMAIEQIRQGFGLMLMHFPDGDLAGHEYGWMSKQQLRAYKHDDDSFGLLLDAMKDSGFYDDTLIIITADHGGHDTTHGTTLPGDMTIPWIINGPGVVAGELKSQVYTFDTAPTVAFALGLPLQADWDGVPIYEAFGMPVDSLQRAGCPGVTP